MYSSIDTYPAPAQSKTTGAIVGAACGAVVGAVVLAAVIAVDRAVYAPTSLYTASALRPVTAAATVPVNAQAFAQSRSVAGAQMAAQTASYQNQEVIMQQPQGIAVFSWTWVIFAAVAGAVNGLFLLNKRQVSMAATTGRREALMAGVAAASMAAAPAFAAYGDAANVFGKPKDVEQFVPISGEGWSATIPSKYNISKEKEADGQVGRWEDNFDAVNNAFVVVRDIGKNDISELGGLDAVRDSIVSPLLGQQAYEGPSISEGGFNPGRYSAAAILDQKEIQKDGKTYYFFELLTRTADGNEGGRHQLFSVTVSNGKLYIFKTQAGDKRWFKGLEKSLRSSLNAFKVA